MGMMQRAGCMTRFPYISLHTPQDSSVAVPQCRRAACAKPCFSQSLCQLFVTAKTYPATYSLQFRNNNEY
jgi:hypothetical protein